MTTRTRYLCRIHDESRPSPIELATHPRGTRLLAVVFVGDEDDARAEKLAREVVLAWQTGDVEDGGTGEAAATLLALPTDIAWLDETGEPGCWREVAAWRVGRPPRG